MFGLLTYTTDRAQSSWDVLMYDDNMPLVSRLYTRTSADPPHPRPRPRPLPAELHKLQRVSRSAGPQPDRGQAAPQQADRPAVAELYPAAVERHPSHGGEEQGGGDGRRGAVRGATYHDRPAAVEGQEGMHVGVKV